ncbi:hypothetical protein AUCHE_05_01890 [Austwickia chelonae NBRC 105200]|uniref:CdaR family transcriptional regulator n=2 Tax=Austwickia TaxID=1184606 RepID=K6VKM4_9MICO|nr:hypothetical protein AUCHE_05_01890 [Austwickia chelonae NBRC 105200]
MEENLPWYKALSAKEKAWVGTAVQAGFAAFVSWYVNTERGEEATADIFTTAPRALIRAMSLRQTLDLLRTVVDVVEEHIPELAMPGEEGALREEVLRYSRDIAFAAAQVYAGAAEARGAWDARLESLIVDAVLRDEGSDLVTSRAAALGWDQVEDVAVMMGSVPFDRDGHDIERLRALAARLEIELLVSTQGNRLVLFLGAVGEIDPVAQALVEAFGPGPVVVGPIVAGLSLAGMSASAAAAGLQAAPAWAGVPRPVSSAELLPERVLVGDGQARDELVRRVYAPLVHSGGGALLETCTAYLACGRSLEAAARLLFVHPNTVRYRLGRIAQTIGYDLAQPREAYVVQVALAVGRLAERSDSISAEL